MAKRCNRRMAVSSGEWGVLIGLFWTDGTPTDTGAGHELFLEYPRGSVLETVEAVINALEVYLVHVSLGEPWTRIIFTGFDQDPAKFDLIINAEEPEQAFVSRYMLEG